MATIIGDKTKANERKNHHINKRMTRAASGAEIAICLNISTPKVCSATGKPVMWYWSLPSRPEASS